MTFLITNQIEIARPGSEWVTYDAEVGLIEQFIVGFDPDHGIFGFRIDITEFIHGSSRSTGWICLSEDASSIRLMKGVIKALGGDHGNLDTLRWQPAALIRSESSPTPIGIAAPETGDYVFFADFYEEAPQF